MCITYKLEARDTFPFQEILSNPCSFRYNICIFSHHCMSTKITEAQCFLCVCSLDLNFFLFVEKQKHTDLLKLWKLILLKISTLNFTSKSQYSQQRHQCVLGAGLVGRALHHLQSACRSVPGRDTEPQHAPSGCSRCCVSVHMIVITPDEKLPACMVISCHQCVSEWLLGTLENMQNECRSLLTHDNTVQ